MPADRIEPFTIAVPESVLDDLRRRLRRTRWSEPLAGEPWALGTEQGYLRDLVEYWIDGYDWRVAEAALNRLHHFRTEIDGQPIHFVHERAADPSATAVVLLSGWPSTFAEFTKVIPQLVDGDPPLHVVAPSLPGFGFSGPTTAPGWTPRRIAGALAALMAGLGYDRYAAHGGDWGAMVSSQLGLVDPAHCIGIHLSMVIAPKPPGDDAGSLSAGERADLDRMYQMGRSEMGYQQIQATRPQTLSVGLADSPAGLAAWIVEKFRAWSDCGGDVESRFTRDELLTNLTIYWVTNTIGSANRIYAEARIAGTGASLPDRPVPVPLGYTRFPGDGFKPPRRWVERLYDVRAWTTVDEGGHFPAYEVPSLLAKEITRFVSGLTGTQSRT